jgi:hypothetical protein
MAQSVGLINLNLQNHFCKEIITRLIKVRAGSVEQGKTVELETYLGPIATSEI